jgi:hypothetical protein
MGQPSHVRRWKQARQDLSNPEVAHHRSLHIGRQSVLAPVDEQLLRWSFELREQGFMVSVQLFTLKACEVSTAFRRKRERAKDTAARRFCNTNTIVLRQVAHECQRPPEVLRREAIDFITFAKRNCNQLL